MASLREIEVEATVPVAGAQVEATIAFPEDRTAVVVFAHGSGSGRGSPRNRFVADRLVRSGFGVLLLDLLTASEERYDRDTHDLRFDVDRLASRLVGAIDWLADRGHGELPVGLYGASTGAAAALVAAAERPGRVVAVVSRGGRPDLAKAHLERVGAPTLLIVGEADPVVLDLSNEAAELMRVPATIEVVAKAGHLFEEPRALDQVAELTVEWFERHLAGASTSRRSS